MKEKKLFLQCDCRDREFMQWLVFDEEDKDWGLYVAFGGTEIKGLRRRLQVAWQILRYGEYYNDGILINTDKEKLKEWLA